MIASDIERFEQNVMPVTESGCWLWMGVLNNSGYGFFKAKTAHRAAYELYIGPVQKGVYVLHKCDTPSCANPAHLYLGTQLDNLRDCKARGRMNPPLGERCAKAKLTAEMAKAIYHATGSQSKIARDFGISQMQVGRIKRGVSWAHLNLGRKK